MATSKARLTYYNGTFWRTVLQADGTHTVQPFRRDGRALASRAAARYYRRPSPPQG